MERFRAWLRENDIILLQERPIAGGRVAVQLRLPDGTEIGLAVKSGASDNAIRVVQALVR